MGWGQLFHGQQWVNWHQPVAFFCHQVCPLQLVMLFRTAVLYQALSYPNCMLAKWHKHCPSTLKNGTARFVWNSGARGSPDGENSLSSGRPASLIQMLWCFKIPAVVWKMPQASFLLTWWATKLCFNSQLSLGVGNISRGEKFTVTRVTCVTEDRRCCWYGSTKDWCF